MIVYVLNWNWWRAWTNSRSSTAGTNTFSHRYQRTTKTSQRPCRRRIPGRSNTFRRAEHTEEVTNDRRAAERHTRHGMNNIGYQTRGSTKMSSFNRYLCSQVSTSGVIMTSRPWITIPPKAAISIIQVRGAMHPFQYDTELALGSSAAVSWHKWSKVRDALRLSLRRKPDSASSPPLIHVDKPIPMISISVESDDEHLPDRRNSKKAKKKTTTRASRNIVHAGRRRLRSGRRIDSARSRSAAKTSGWTRCRQFVQRRTSGTIDRQCALPISCRQRRRSSAYEETVENWYVRQADASKIGRHSLRAGDFSGTMISPPTRRRRQQHLNIRCTAGLSTFRHVDALAGERAIASH